MAKVFKTVTGRKIRVRTGRRKAMLDLLTGFGAKLDGMVVGMDRMGTRLDELEIGVNGVSSRLGELETWMDGRLADMEQRTDSRFAEMDKRFDDMGSRMKKVEDKVEDVDKRLSLLVDRVTDVESQLSSGNDRLASVEKLLGDLSRKTDGLTDHVKLLDDRMVFAEERLDGIEKSGYKLMELVRNIQDETGRRLQDSDEHLASVFERVLQVEEQLAGLGSQSRKGRVELTERGGGDAKVQEPVASSAKLEAKFMAWKKDAGIMVDRKISVFASTVKNLEKGLDEQSIAKNDFLTFKSLAKTNQRSIQQLEKDVARISTPSR